MNSKKYLYKKSNIAIFTKQCSAWGSVTCRQFRPIILRRSFTDTDLTFSVAVCLSLRHLADFLGPKQTDHNKEVVVRRGYSREFKKLPRLRQRVRYKAIGFNEQTRGFTGTCVITSIWYISLPYSAKQQREMTN